MKYQNCLEIPEGTRFTIRTNPDGTGKGWITSVLPTTIVERSGSMLMADEGSVLFDVVSGELTTCFDDVVPVGNDIYLGLEDLHSVVE